MERLVLALLLTCALIGAGLVPDDVSGDVDENASSSDGANAHPLSPLPAVATGPVDSASDELVVSKILGRFAVRHTGLPLRERKRVARVIVEEAALHDLDPELVMAVIEVESAGYHLATSHVGAMGLMQLLPSTGKELAGKLAIDWKGPDTLFDPVINVRLGTAYLRELADRYDGNVSIALAAYNWGPGRIDRRIRRGATVPSLYIEQVMRAIDRYADNSPSPTRS